MFIYRDITILKNFLPNIDEEIYNIPGVSPFDKIMLFIHQ